MLAPGEGVQEDDFGIPWVRMVEESAQLHPLPSVTLRYCMLWFALEVELRDGHPVKVDGRERTTGDIRT